MSAPNVFLGIHSNYINHFWPSALLNIGISGIGVAVASVTTAKIIGIALTALGLYGLANLFYYSIKQTRNPDEFKQTIESNPAYKHWGVASITLFILPVALLQKIGLVPKIS